MTIIKTTIAAVSLSAVLLSGCSGIVVKQVSESNSATSGTFDGRWQATVVNTAGLQYGPDNWQFTCDDRSGQDLGVIVVENGKAQSPWDANGKATTFVSNKGKFRFAIPTGIVAAASGTSDTSISNGNMTAIIYGSLKSGKGKFTMGIKEFGNAGCTSKISFTKL